LARNSQKQAKKNGTGVKILLWVGGIIMALIVVLLFLGTLVNISTNASEKVAKDFIGAVQNGDTVTAYTLTSSDFMEATSVSDLKIAVDNAWDPFLPDTDPAIKSKEISAGTGQAATSTVIAEWDLGDQGKIAFIVNLVKEGDDWKVVNAETKELAPGEKLDISD